MKAFDIKEQFLNKHLKHFKTNIFQNLSVDRAFTLFFKSSYLSYNDEFQNTMH